MFNFWNPVQIRDRCESNRAVREIKTETDTIRMNMELVLSHLQIQKLGEQYKEGLQFMPVLSATAQLLIKQKGKRSDCCHWNMKSKNSAALQSGRCAVTQSFMVGSFLLMAHLSPTVLQSSYFHGPNCAALRRCTI